MTVINPSPFYPYLSVHASAGSGKTHQLVNRLIYLLLYGAEPGGILAITFTRKAAAEMTQRLLQRVQRLANSDETELVTQFLELQIVPTTELRQRAARLYESLLHCPYPIRSTTFHAFCQDLLRRFPMEADVPPGFELLELTHQLIDEAWDSFASELTRNPQSDAANAMDVLLRQLGLEPSRRALLSFLEHRSDWWALTQGMTDPIDAVFSQLTQHIKADVAGEPRLEFLDDTFTHTQLREFQSLLRKQPGKYNNDSADHIDIALNQDITLEGRFESAWLAFFTKDNSPRSREVTNASIKKLGEAGSERFVELHTQFCDRLIEVQRQQHAIDTLLLSQAWLICGERLLGNYQRIKQTQRVLDFADLEWNSYLLLNTATHADWVQYKLDQRIDHLLVDEFQDTNPTQWQLLLPLLQELAAGETTRARSVLFVGDSKQSIYSFRRAEPRLFDVASDWLAQHLPGAEQATLSKSWRSSPAIIDFVNTVFHDNPNLQLTHFEPHVTEHTSLYGRVCLLPLMAKAKTENESGLRNPLTTPRPQAEPAQYHEAQMIAQTIRELLAEKTIVGRGNNTRYLRYNDIMILFRSRTRVSDFERALREAQIPYIGTERGTLLESLEVQDMINLLQWLITPFNQLALAGILRSPLFAASDDDLMQLAGKGDWFARLLELAPTLPPDHPLARAVKYLQLWKPLADQLPVHDLVDRIYSDANVFSRYRTAFPKHLHPRVIANLVRFLELALETDSGRYPSLTRFMVWLEQLRQQEQDSPDQPPGQGEQDRVRLLTVHESKGLEAPVVFVADTSREPKAEVGTRILIDWPATAAKPQNFLLMPSSRFPNSYCETLVARKEDKDLQEDANLLYVALTRAEQYLYISASEQATGWYGAICRACAIEVDTLTESHILNEAGQPPSHIASKPPSDVASVDVHPGLQAPLTITPRHIEIAPSHTIEWQAIHHTDTEEDARERGIIIHAMFEAMARIPTQALAEVQQQFSNVDPQRLQHHWDEVQTVIAHHPELFEPQHFQRAYVEVPVIYTDAGRTVHGIIDRLVCYANKVMIVDYKTQRLHHDDDLNLAVQPYHEQLRLYAAGVRRLYPELPVYCQVLFTALAQGVNVPT